MSFNLAQLEAFDRFLGTAEAVIPCVEACHGNHSPDVIVLRHDIDANLEKAVAFAEWEHERGYRSSYFALHTAAYFADKPALYDALVHIESLGHEIGIHHDALSVVCERYSDPDVWWDAAIDVLRLELAEMRAAGFDVVGCCAHGGNCSRHGISNLDLWDHAELEDLGLEYEAYFLKREAGAHLSDNHGSWHQPLALIPGKQLHALCHPQHWPLG